MDTAEAAVDALLELVRWLPSGWEFDHVPGQRIAIRNGIREAEIVVSVDDAAYRAEVEPDTSPVSLAEVGNPREAIDALERIFLVTTLVVESGFQVPDDAT